MKLAVILAMAPIALLAQTPPATGSVSGRIIDADSGAGIADFPVEQHVRTDARGYYKITGLKPGRFEIRLFGERMWPELSTTMVNVIAGQETTGVDIPVRLDAEISGRVLDQDKEPVSGVPVYAIGQEYYGGAVRSFTESSSSTNDRGEFAIRNIRAGRTILLLMEERKEYHQALAETPADPALRRPVYRATYYPNADSSEGAALVTLRSGEHRAGMDIQVLRSPNFCIDGTLTLDGAPASLGFKVTNERTSSANMIPGSASSGPIGVSSGPDGKIRICDLYPGQFRIAALRGRPLEVFGAASVAVGKEDVHNVRVDAGPPVMVPGEVVWDESPPDGSPAAQFTLMTQSITNDSMPMGNRPRYPIPGTFTFPVLRTVEYTLQPLLNASNYFPNSYVKDVTYGPLSILHEPFRAAEGTLRITMGNDAGTIKLTAPPGAQILILPDAVSGEAELAAAMMSGQADYDGTFSRRLKPGKYRVLATRDIIDRTPECIGRIWQARIRGQEADAGPRATVSVTLTETVSLAPAR